MTRELTPEDVGEILADLITVPDDPATERFNGSRIVLSDEEMAEFRATGRVHLPDINRFILSPEAKALILKRLGSGFEDGDPMTG